MCRPEIAKMNAEYIGYSTANTAGKELLAKWGLPENLIGIGNCILGFEAEKPSEKPRKEGRIIKID